MNQEETVPLPVLLEHLKWNLQRMAEMEKNAPTPYFRDAALQRFEFTLTSVLKCIRAAARDHHLNCESDADALALAVAQGWLPASTDGQDLLESCKQMKPESRAQYADQVFAKLADYHRKFRNLFETLSSLAQPK